MKRLYLYSLILSASLCLFYTSTIGQNKYEREYKIKEDKVPQNSVQWIREVFKDVKKVKWYVEESESKKSFEAKFRYLNRHFSVEFDTTGKIEDVEEKIEWELLNDDLKKNLSFYLESNYTKYKIIKIQKQYSGDSNALHSIFDDATKKKMTIKYEMEFHGKNENKDEIWEGLFNDTGELIEIRKIVLQPTNNLEF